MIEQNIGQLERKISKRIKDLYNDRFGQSPSQIICHFFDTEIVISLENSVTQAEQTLVKEGYASLAEQVRFYLDRIIKPELKKLIEEIIGESIIDLITNTNLATGRTGIIVVLNQLPEIWNAESITNGNVKYSPD
ncbi:DUF2294 domain-containing protein [Nostoc sp. C117]|uniref:DUF2294 domain-containing protein n=1 Tax=Nostoc sp. C117 TaxID=3349875 RepID=UPI00370D454B